MTAADGGYERRSRDGRAAGNGAAHGFGRGRAGRHGRAAEPERAYLIAVDTGNAAGWSAEESLLELAALVETAGGEVVGSDLPAPRSRSIPCGTWAAAKPRSSSRPRPRRSSHMLVADDELSPKQQRQLGGPAGREGLGPQRRDPGHLRHARPHARGPHPGGVWRGSSISCPV